MPQRARLSDTTVAPPQLTPLELVAAISTRLTEEGARTTTLSGVLEMVCTGLKAEGCALWRVASNGHERVAIAGDETLLDESPVPTTDGDLSGKGSARYTLTAADAHPVGAFLFLRKSALKKNEQLALQAIANLLGSALLTAEQSQQFADTVASNTRAVEAQHKFMQCIVDSLPVGLYVVDREYRVHAWNRKRETGMQGVLRQDALGRTIFEILRRQPADLLRREFDEVFRTGKMIQLEMESSADGQPRTYRVSKIPMHVESDAVTHMITIGEDITDWKRAQERIAEAQRLAALGQLSAGVMHEINNPLATIGAGAETMSLQLHDPGVPEVVQHGLDEYCHIIDQEFF